jgi:hypothetical protein
VIDVKKPTGFRITKEANEAGEEILKQPGNLGTISELAILGISLIIQSKDETHQQIEWSTISQDSTGIMKGRMNDYENHEALALLYSLTFEKCEPEDIWQNIQKAASQGIILLKSKYFTHQSLIDWEEVNKDFL